jgi:hypothetical protein
MARLMLRIEISTLEINNQEPDKTIRLGTSSIPKTGRVNQPRDNGIEIGASRSILTSTSFLD